MTELHKLYEQLKDAYGHQDWWPAEGRFEMITGAILVQNTNWKNVEKALAQVEPWLDPKMLFDMPTEQLQQLIRPSGFFRMKEERLKAFLRWFKEYDFDFTGLEKLSTPRFRQELLSIKGIGPETADSILLYGFNRQVFVIDAYTQRIMKRLGYSFPMSYEEARTWFESRLTEDTSLYQDYHAQFVVHAKSHCRKKPVCNGCPLEPICLKVLD